MPDGEYIIHLFFNTKVGNKEKFIGGFKVLFDIQNAVSGG